MKKNKKQTIGSLVGILVGLMMYFLVKQFLFTPPSFDNIMMQTASKINESCPIMVDQNTRLDNVIALSNNTFQYNYTLINFVKDSVDINTFENYMQPKILNNVKTNPDLKIYRDNKTTMAYYYKDKNGNFVDKISISEEQYRNEE